MPVPQITTSHVVSERDSIIGINTEGKLQPARSAEVDPGQSYEAEFDD